MTQGEIRKADEDMNRVMVDHRRPEPPQQQHLPENLPRHNRHLHLKCPRCDSTNTKFCYYNNYSLSQPRYFCKTCRRYWTEGGTLRSVPVGGGCRKGKRAKTSAYGMGSSSTSRSDVNLNNPRVLLPPSSTNSSLLLGGSNSGLIGPNRVKEMGNMTISPMPPPSYYPNGGFFPSFTSMRSLGQHPSVQPLISHHHQRQNFGALFGIGGGSNSNPNSSNSTNMALLQGFNNNTNNNQQQLPPPMTMAQPQQHMINDHSMFNHHVINSTPHHNIIGEPKINNMDQQPHYQLYPNGHVNIGSSWNQNLVINNNNNNNSATTDSGAYVMNPNQWLDHDLHMFNGPPPGF